MDRRTFLGTMTAATLLSNHLGWASTDHKVDKIGVQLYTVRKEMKTDFEGTLAKVAAVGYKEVELAEFTMNPDVLYFSHTPQDLRAALDHKGLSAPSTHVNYKSLAPDKFPWVIAASEVLGNKYIVNPWIDEEVRKQPDGWKRAAETFNRAGEMSKKSGIQFAYHNHWFEYIPVDGKLPYDTLLEGCDANLVKMEMDICWTVIGGQDPVKYFDRYPGRFPLVHVKDMKALPKVDTSGKQDFGDSLTDMTDVGSGVIDWKRIFSKAEEAGIKYYFVEHDHPQSALDSISISYKYMQGLRF